MCTTCGCGHDETKIDGAPVGEHEHRHPDGIVHTHSHAHEGAHAHGDAHEDGQHWHRHEDAAWHSHVRGGGSAHVHDLGAAGGLGAAHAPGVAPTRIVQIEQDILAKNDAYAASNRRLLADRGVFALNLVSSPGSGKTTLLVRTIDALRGKVPVAVIEGDQQTSLDADRIRASGAAAVQVNTGKGCHLDAHMVGHALSKLDPGTGSLLLIENVGNLVCPAAFDLGEAHKVVILSVTEGDDKPQKYPDMFHAADLLLVNKIDLLPYVRFDADAAIEYARRVRPGLAVMQVSATTGEGVDAWLAWLERGVAATRTRRDQDVRALRQRIAELEAELAGRAAGVGAEPGRSP
jgi:hydrogenase nickel incorporation protein HypB